MKLNISMMKLMIRMTILMILFVMLFMISLFLYGAKYWPDVYNYINANITIKRIRTLSELNLTIVTINEDYTTETYSTVNIDYTDVTTDKYGNKEDFGDFEDFFNDRKKRSVEIEEVGKDYSEVPRNLIINYVFMNDVAPTEVINDSVDEENLTTRSSDDVEMVDTRQKHGGAKLAALQNDTGPTNAVFPWIATIFVKSESTDQFNYYCDGALLSENIVLTAARCVVSAAHARNFIIFLGKQSLQASTDGESLHKVKEVIVHENFTNEDDNVKNDLAILVLEDPAVFSDRVQPACIQGAQVLQVAATTAWAPSGDLTVILFEKENTNDCEKKKRTENTFCATYGNDIALCPSYGGVYAERQTDSWCVRGIRTDDPTNRGFCIEKTVLYTSLNGYTEWIDQKIDLNKL